MLFVEVSLLLHSNAFYSNKLTDKLSRYFPVILSFIRVYTMVFIFVLILLFRLYMMNHPSFTELGFRVDIKGI